MITRTNKKRNSCGIPSTHIRINGNKHLDRAANETTTCSDAKQLLWRTKAWFQKFKQKTKQNGIKNYFMKIAVILIWREEKVVIKVRDKRFLHEYKYSGRQKI